MSEKTCLAFDNEYIVKELTFSLWKSIAKIIEGASYPEEAGEESTSENDLLQNKEQNFRKTFSILSHIQKKQGFRELAWDKMMG